MHSFFAISLYIFIALNIYHLFFCAFRTLIFAELSSCTNQTRNISAQSTKNICEYSPIIPAILLLLKNPEASLTRKNQIFFINPNYFVDNHNKLTGNVKKR